MSRRSRRNDSLDDALGLFLDTISNGFGGILFIGMLVAVLLQLTGTRVLEPSAADMQPPEELDRVHQHLEAELAHLRMRQTSLQELMTLDSTERDHALRQESAELSAEATRLAAELQILQRRREQSAAQRQRLAEEIAQSKSRQRDLQQQLDQVQAALASAQAAAPRRIRLPRAQSTEKQQVAVFIHNGRLAFPHQYDHRGEVTGINAAHANWADDRNSVRPKIGAGHHIDGNQPADVVTLFRPFDRQSVFIELVVWPDSFNEAALVRDALIDAGFNYNFMLMKAGEAVMVGAGRTDVQ